MADCLSIVFFIDLVNEQLIFCFVLFCLANMSKDSNHRRQTRNKFGPKTFNFTITANQLIDFGFSTNSRG